MLTEIIKPNRLTCIVDVGASPIDGPAPYQAMLDSGLCQVVGFEPDESALAALNKTKTEHETYLPNVIGDGAPGVLHICAALGMSGLLKPDEERLKCFKGFSEWGEVRHTEAVQTYPLDEVMPFPVMDFLKVDVQGGEIGVFNGAPRLLSSAVAVQAEVSFFPLYHNQPTIGDIDADLRLRCFIPHRFMNIKNWMISPLHSPANPYAAMNQLLEADIVYVRDFGRMHLMSEEQLSHLALLAEYVFKSPDLVMRCLREMSTRGSIQKSAVNEYLGTITL